jgi:two-component system phosphate regulon sensor histidine kinase PhoR
MNSTLKKIGGILTILVLLPIIVVITFEIANLNENEKRIGEIYKNQLQTILFSLNQYSEDFISSWRSQISLAVTEGGIASDNSSALFSKLLNENKALEGIFFIEVNKDEPTKIFTKNLSDDKTFEINKFSEIIDSNNIRIDKLQKMSLAGYYKIDPFGESIERGKSLLVSIISNKYICGFIVNSEAFIRQNLSQQIQQITQENFVIACSRGTTKNIIYSTGQFNFDKENLSLALWLFPEYNIGIQLKGETINVLAKNRLFNNIFILIVLTLVLLLGLLFVFRIIKKEVELAQIKSDFVSNVSHELRTPLALISMYSETLEMGRVNSDEKRNEYYKIISTETNRLSRIVNSILNFSKIEAGKRKYSFEKIDINKIVADALSSYEHQLKNDGFTCSFNANEDLSLINADKEALTEAIINLIDNAIKYSNEKKQIDIITGKDKNFIFVEVKDSGIGISSEDQEKIFDKFFRVTSGQVHNTKGTGLGLSLVKHIVAAHDGNIELKSKLGEGSSFRLNFPKQKI